MIEINVKRLHEDSVLPLKAHIEDAGYDLFAYENIIIPAHKNGLVKTGIALGLPVGYEAQIRPRSGLALKNSITVLNTPGTIDAGYRGEICVILMNHSDIDFVVEKGSKIAQMVIAEVLPTTLNLVEELDETLRGTGGFGSTGK